VACLERGVELTHAVPLLGDLLSVDGLVGAADQRCKRTVVVVGIDSIDALVLGSADPRAGGPPKNPDSVLRVLRRAVELGVNFIDTADSYGPYVSEELIAKALAPYPRDLVIATKGGWNRPGPNQWTHDASPKHLREAAEGSLRRLRVDRIDVYQFTVPRLPSAASEVQSGIGPEDLVHTLDRHAALAHCGDTAFHRAGAHVACGKNAGPTRLQRPRRTTHSFPRGRVDDRVTGF
jgi:hypothetical protein